MFRIIDRLKESNSDLLGQNTSEYTYSPLLVSFAKSLFCLLMKHTVKTFSQNGSMNLCGCLDKTASNKIHDIFL